MGLFDAPEIPRQTQAYVRRAALHDRLPQSVLLTGGSDRLREKCALELAGSVICENRMQGAPCGKCAACKKIKAGVHPDVVRVKPEKDKKSVSIAAVRELVLDRLYIAPNEAENKVFIFYEAQELSPLIQNALLKTLEEPPVFVMFIFLCDQRDRLLTTVLSRVTELTLGDVLTAERKNKEAELGDVVLGIAKALARGDEYDLMVSTAPLTKNRALMKKTAQRLILTVRDAACGAFSPGETGEAALLLQASLTLPQLFAVKARMEDIVTWANANANENLLQTMFSSLLAQIKQQR